MTKIRQPPSNTERLSIDDVLLPGLPRDLIIARYSAAPGKEIASRKFFSRESSSCLVANVFGPFFDKPTNLPPLPGIACSGSAYSVEPEVTVRFPWRGGKHPCLDVLIETSDVLIGVESKRYEPFRPKAERRLSDAYSRNVWGDRMNHYVSLLASLRRGAISFARLDAAQLVKHAFALRTAIDKKRFKSKRAALYYLYAEPRRWPVESGAKEITDMEHEEHQAEITRFASRVSGDEVIFVACSYRQLLATWMESDDHQAQAHAAAVRTRFDV